MGALLCKCCCTCKSLNNNRNSVGISPEEHLKLLLLGPTDSGKTELAHLLTKTKRTNFEPTNGSKFYQTSYELDSGERQTIGITEIGGSIEMQRIWHHYFTASMAIIYCFDMSASYELLQSTFQLFQQVISHSFVRGKSILLIGTKSDLVDEGLQLYDIENNFQLAAMANKYACNLRMSYVGRGDEADVQQGMNWLINAIKSNYNDLKMRIKRDTNMKAWQEQTEKLIKVGKMKPWRYRRFVHSNIRNQRRKVFWKYASRRFGTFRVRPNTAPAVFTISKSSLNTIISVQTSTDTIDTTATVPNGNLEEHTDSNQDLSTVNEIKLETDI